jgi:hypothetical protein
MPQPSDADLSLPSIFEFLSMISPFLVVFLFVLISIINTNLKGMIYLLGIILLFSIVFLFQNVLRTAAPPQQRAFCKIFKMNQHHDVPSMNSAIFLFTFIYLLLPMALNGIMNFPLIILLLIIYVVDVVIKISSFCTSPVGIVLGSMIGLLWGVTWYFVIYSNNKELLYYDDLLSNKIACSRPTQQQFKCSVYKNGELLSTI